MKAFSLKSMRLFFGIAYILFSSLACSTAPFSQGPAVEIVPVPTSLERAHAAFLVGNAAEAEQLFIEAMQDPTISEESKNQAWETFTLASLANKHPYLAFVNLDSWKAALPDATKNHAWQRTWLKSLMSLPPYEQRQRIQAAIQQGDLHEQVLANAFLIAQSLSLPPDYLNTFGLFAQAYDTASVVDRAGLERALFNALQYATNATFSQILQQSTPESDPIYPWTIVLLEGLRRAQAYQSGDVPNLQGRINYPSLFADPQLLFDVLNTRPEEIRSLQSEHCVALALPLSGPYSSVAWKISRGASAAQEELSRAGSSLELAIINTDQANWLTELERLPAECVAVGGPLQASTYSTIKERGLLSKHAFFAFLSQIDPMDEGQVAWRFFTSPTDQIQATLAFTNALGVQNYGVLAPDDTYGQRMSGLFGELSPSAPNSTFYSPSDTTTWNELTASFLNVRMVDEVPVPQSTMQAVFIPDSWKNTEIMIPYILFQGEDRLVFMGTTLWEQGLGQEGNSSALATPQGAQFIVFPGMWNALNPSPKALDLINMMQASQQEAPDFWVGLGYDFVRLASFMQLPQNFSADIVNNRLMQAQTMPWSMAPISWSGGQARQQLFVFTPTSKGLEEANIETFSKNLYRVYDRFDRRVRKAYRDLRLKEGE